MEYKIIEAEGEAENLQDAVNRHIKEGWEPVGGVAVAYSPQSLRWWFYQAIAKGPGTAEDRKTDR